MTWLSKLGVGAQSATKGTYVVDIAQVRHHVVFAVVVCNLAVSMAVSAAVARTILTCGMLVSG